MKVAIYVRSIPAGKEKILSVYLLSERLKDPLGLHIPSRYVLVSSMPLHDTIVVSCDEKGVFVDCFVLVRRRRGELGDKYEHSSVLAAVGFTVVRP